MRRILWLLIPVLFLAGVVVLNNAASGWRYVVSGTPGDVLYAAGFDDFLDEWQQYDDGRLAATIEGNYLSLTINDVGTINYSLAAPIFADFDLRVLAAALGGPVNNGYGVIFRFVDNDNYYAFQVSSDGYYQVRRVVAGVQKELSTWISSPVVQQGLGTVNHLRVVADGDQFRFYVNGEGMALCIPDDPDAFSTYVESSGECMEGQMVDVLTDSNLAQGQIGMLAEAFDEPGVVVAYDNLAVLGPEPITNE